jgi:hypothetical protein
MQGNTPYLRDGTLDTALKRALSALAGLVEQGAPKPVLAAANHAIDCYKCGVQPHTWSRDVLFKYADEQQRQDRFGKPKE